MKTVSLDEIENRPSPATVRRSLSSALDATDVAINYYELDSGESFAFGYHSHERQEELFVVLSGTVTFETADGRVEVSADEAIRFAPGESQRGTNTGDERVRALAIGAPQDPGNLYVLRECPQCGTRTPAAIDRDDDADVAVTICLECGMETGRYSA